MPDFDIELPVDDERAHSIISDVIKRNTVNIERRRIIDEMEEER